MITILHILLESTAKGAVEMMAENSLTFLPLYDPDKKVAQEVIEKGFDGSDNIKVKGKGYEALCKCTYCLYD